MPTQADVVRAHLAKTRPEKYGQFAAAPDAGSPDVTIAQTAPQSQAAAEAAAIAKGPIAALKAAPAKAAPKAADMAPGEGRKMATEIIQAAVDDLRKAHPGKYSEAAAWDYLLANDKHVQDVYAMGELVEGEARRPKAP